MKKMSQYEYAEYLSQARNYHTRESIRIGQAYWNCLPNEYCNYIKEHADYIDPFHNDDLVPAFLSYVYDNFVEW